MSETMQVTLINDTAELERLNMLFEDFGALHHLHVQEQYAAYLCLEELVTNIINYAWPEGGSHEFDVQVTIDSEAIKLRLEDNGVPFDPTQFPEPDLTKPSSQRSIGGLGIHLVRQNTNEMFYQRFEDKNILSLKRKRMSAQPAQPAQT
jgi:anti-sigma regulatory factor (Ser/Thr protein kinase)